MPVNTQTFVESLDLSSNTKQENYFSGNILESILQEYVKQYQVYGRIEKN